MNKVRLSFLVIIATTIFSCTPHNEKTEIKVQLSEIEYIYSLSNYNSDLLFMSVFRATQNSYNAAEGDFVSALGNNISANHPDFMLASVFNTIELRDKITFQSTNEEVIKVLTELVKSANEVTMQILKQRIELMLSSSLFNKLEVLVKELPDKNTYSITVNRKVDTNSISELLQKRGDLGFWETHELSSIWEYLDAADKATKEVLFNNEQSNSQNNMIDSIKMGKSLFSILIPSVSQDGSIQKGCLIGYSNVNDTALVNQYLNTPNIRSIFPRDFITKWSSSPEINSGFMQLFAIKNTRDGKAPLSGEWVVSAKVEESNSTPSVYLSMNAEGANIWARMTNYNIDKQIAIVIDNTVYAAPFVYSEIKDGNTAFTGNFTVEEATNLASILSAGRLPGITVKVVSVNN